MTKVNLSKILYYIPSLIKLVASGLIPFSIARFRRRKNQSQGHNYSQTYNANSASGATLTEYALAVALILVGLLIFRTVMVSSVQGYYDTRKNTLNYVDKTPLVSS